ncbi:MAG: amidohydrolase family protein, partial [Actinobacteria bacterium]|nr:amidohydrolase family protein [Actinomycetota bacterium]
CGIHSTALTHDDFEVVATNGGSVVWSPLSNYLLYGATTDLRAMKDSGVLIGLGSDWSPTGSKNLLGELKVARLVSEHAGDGNALFTPEELVAMATINPARICKWSSLLGSIEAGKLADLIAISGTAGDPYERLLDARETSISLVVVDGVPRAGQRHLMERFEPGGSHEPISVGRSLRLLDLTPTEEVDPLGGITLAEAKKRLRDTLADLPGAAADLDSGATPEGFAADWEAVAVGPPPDLLAHPLETPRWVVKLDFAEDDDLFPPVGGPLDERDLADWVEPMVFEDLTVADDPGFLHAIVHSLNLPRFVKEGLPGTYGHHIVVPSATPVPDTVDEGG